MDYAILDEVLMNELTRAWFTFCQFLLYVLVPVAFIAKERAPAFKPVRTRGVLTFVFTNDHSLATREYPPWRSQNVRIISSRKHYLGYHPQRGDIVTLLENTSRSMHPEMRVVHKRFVREASGEC